ncbi:MULTISPECIES: thiol:disulfide interchange protein DsbA/DsbL [Pseudoalteromonas]|uniref:thiol:disulfide interchange protein DsbA/DsbL n=1 Tax=Pseudoalteromonas TaxID=53246 RepID=UPI000784E48F|nr:MULTISPECIES: thiol:disulfide interchange protein DsbA/DsbL [Pseudoalteromonas]MCF7520434.1 thiol:disulfide interchange protein DsbA/DsbL [Pseudoalteromonas sp. L21]UJX25288.1 thiol:disulfide interchange protein DsbA/DsbL [Pseudoalteromonas sp. CF6-2]|tara:strand:- start:2695 stop:3333 length:639 start_codon:yes stop_codon:yes gene_type:complete
MIKLVKATLLAMTLGLAANATAAQYEEGKHYEAFDARASKKPEVKEFFSFYCPHCNSFESIVAQLKPLLNDGVAFKKSHVDFSGPRDPEIQAMLAQAYATAAVLPQKDALVAAIFNHIHGKRARINELADMKDIFVSQGVSEADFDKYYNSFSVRTMASKMKRDQEYYKQKGALKGVPTFIVNGKYRLILGAESGISDAKGMADLINYLADK